MTDKNHKEQPEKKGSTTPYDENLLERSRTQWQFGDWQSLAELQRETLQHHPDRAKLALLAAAGHLQSGSMDQARQYVRLARDWGCDKKLVSRILIAGVHNSLGRAAALAGKQPKALDHFERAVAIGTPGCDVRLLQRARVDEQLRQFYSTSDYPYFQDNFIVGQNQTKPLATSSEGFLIINSIPKSGTYLISLFLKEIGVKDSCLHLRNDFYWNLKGAPLDNVISDIDQYKEHSVLSESLKIVNNNEFCVAHLEFSLETENIIKKYSANHVFLVRNLRDALVSHMRFIEDERRVSRPGQWAEEPDHKKKFIAYFKSVGSRYLRGMCRQVNWLDRRGVCTIKYEAVLGDLGKDAQVSALKSLLGLARCQINPDQALYVLKECVIGKETRTYSGSRSNTNAYWSEEAEKIFIDHLGYAANQRLGYD